MSLYDPETMVNSRYLSEFVRKFIEAVEESTQIVEVLKKVCFMAYIAVLFLSPLGIRIIEIPEMVIWAVECPERLSIS